MLVVPRPEVQPALNTHRIALTQPGNRLDYFADSRWGAALPQVLGALAVESLLASKTFTVVTGTDPQRGQRRFPAAADRAAFRGGISRRCHGIAPGPRGHRVPADQRRAAPGLGRCDAEVWSRRARIAWAKLSPRWMCAAAALAEMTGKAARWQAAAA